MVDGGRERDEANLGDLLAQIEPAVVRMDTNDAQRARRCAGGVLAEAPFPRDIYGDPVGCAQATRCFGRRCTRSRPRAP